MTIEKAIETITALNGRISITATKPDGTICGFVQVPNGTKDCPLFGFGGHDYNGWFEPLPTIQTIAGKLPAMIAAKGDRFEVHEGGELVMYIGNSDYVPTEYIPFKDL